jgi:hypothetical protein
MLLQQQLIHPTNTYQKEVRICINNSSEVIRATGKLECINLNSDPQDVNL